MRLLYLAISFLLISCATNEINVKKGTFQAMKPPNIYGSGRYLEDWSQVQDGKNYIISFDANIGKNKTIPLPGLMNKSPETPANINYRLIENTLGFQFYRVTKKDSPIYTGFGGGIQNFPYGFIMSGYNGKSIEVGGVAFWGLAINKASYEGVWYYLHDFTMGMASDTEYLEYVKFKDISILHSYAGLVTHASYYWEKFAINYAVSVSNPWLVYKLPAANINDGYQVSKGDNADIFFWFPVLLMQDIGISYTPHKIKYRLGVNQITGIKFPGQYWGLSIQMAYGW
jgi:hypothetical protein